MKAILLSIVLMSSWPAMAQFRVKKNLLHSLAAYFTGERPAVKSTGEEHFAPPAGLESDPVEVKSLRSPLLFASASGNQSAGELYWMSSITTQSYNRGKLGTYYYWDLQGNLRESRTFFDIAGRNKRGLKLVFPRR